MRAMILAAGRGERLRPLTDHTPKPLIEAGGKPLIVHLIEALVREGIDEIIVNTAHLGEKIQAHLGDGRLFGARIQYSLEYEALETGGGIFQALPLLGSEPFLVINGDIATDFPFGTLRDIPVDLAHLILVPNPDHHPTGDFGLLNGLAQNGGDPRFTFGGIGVYRPTLFTDCKAGRFPLAPLLRGAMDKGRISAELWEKFWMDIGTLERLESFDRYLRS
jgi:N-acetyl-alpha-D-muramate 1-phosphate uridylyltransferase